MKHVFEVFDNYGIKYTVSDREVNGVPIVYKSKYHFIFLDLYGETVLFLSATREFSLDSFVSDSLYLGKKLSIKVVLVLDTPDLDEINRLIKSHVSFLSKDAMFIPFLGIIFSKVLKPIELRSKYTVNQQRVLIELLLSQNKEIYVDSLVNKLDLSTPTIYRVLKYFTDLGYIKSEHGKYSYLISRNKIHEDSMDYYINPISAQYIIAKEILDILDIFDIPVFKTGFDAVSNYSNIASQNNSFGIVERDLVKLSKRLNMDKRLEDNRIDNLYSYLKKNQMTNKRYNFIINDSVSKHKSNKFIDLIDQNLDKMISNNKMLENSKSILEVSENKKWQNKYLFEDQLKLSIWKYEPSFISGVVDPINLSLLDYDIDAKPREAAALKDLKEYTNTLLKELDTNE